MRFHGGVLGLPNGVRSMGDDNIRIKLITIDGKPYLSSVDKLPSWDWGDAKFEWSTCTIKYAAKKRTFEIQKKVKTSIFDYRVSVTVCSNKSCYNSVNEYIHEEVKRRSEHNKLIKIRENEFVTNRMPYNQSDDFAALLALFKTDRSLDCVVLRKAANRLLKNAGCGVVGMR
jgi:hypothetical protein